MAEAGQESKVPFKTIMDPPSGWKYGFPREVPVWIGTVAGRAEDLKDWLRSYNYPEEDLDFALEHMRYWRKE